MPVLSIVCGFEEIRIFETNEVQENALPIAGLDPLGGGSKDPEVTRLKTQDPSTEGIRVKLSGGKITDNVRSPTRGKPASAVIEFQCDPDRTGLEGLKDDNDIDQQMSRLGRRDDDDGDDDDKSKDKTRSLQYKSFDLIDDESYVLRLDWKTKYACEDYKRENPSEPSGSGGGHWGLFTWLIIM